MTTIRRKKRKVSKRTCAPKKKSSVKNQKDAKQGWKAVQLLGAKGAAKINTLKEKHQKDLGALHQKHEKAMQKAKLKFFSENGIDAMDNLLPYCFVCHQDIPEARTWKYQCIRCSRYVCWDCKGGYCGAIYCDIHWKGAHKDNGMDFLSNHC